MVPVPHESLAVFHLIEDVAPVTVDPLVAYAVLFEELYPVGAKAVFRMVYGYFNGTRDHFSVREAKLQHDVTEAKTTTGSITHRRGSVVSPLPGSARY